MKETEAWSAWRVHPHPPLYCIPLMAISRGTVGVSVLVVPEELLGRGGVERCFWDEGLAQHDALAPASLCNGCRN